MNPVELLVSEERGVSRQKYVVEQGVPVPGISREEAERLCVYDESGNRASANVGIEMTDPDGKVRWVLVSLPVDVKAGEKRGFTLREGDRDPAGPTLMMTSASWVMRRRNSSFSASWP